MSAIVLALVSGLGFGSAAIFARVGMQGVSPLSSTFISVAVSFLTSMILALVFALSDIKSLPPVAIALFLALGALNFLGGRNFSYQAIGPPRRSPRQRVSRHGGGVRLHFCHYINW
jgi:uncharacterized membrane protein